MELMPQVLLAAVQAAGERYEDETTEQYSTRVLQNGLAIMAMMSPSSWVGKALLDMETTRGVFVGEIVDVEFLDNSKRYQFTFKSTRGSKFSADKLDRIKTDRIDDSYGPLVRKMVKQFKVGDVVRVWKKMEEAGETSDGMRHSSILYMERLR